LYCCIVHLTLRTQAKQQCNNCIGKKPSRHETSIGLKVIETVVRQSYTSIKWGTDKRTNIWCCIYSQTSGTR